MWGSGVLVVCMWHCCGSVFCGIVAAWAACLRTVMGEQIWVPGIGHVGCGRPLVCIKPIIPSTCVVSWEAVLP